MNIIARPEKIGMRFVVRALTLLLALSAVTGVAQIPYPNPIKHVVFVIQENRTPDNLFGALLTWPGINPSNYDIASSGTNSKGQTIPLAPIPLGNLYDLSHAHHAFLQMYDRGKMDGADLITCTGTCSPNPQFAYVDNSTHILDPYLTLVAQYGWANYMFQTNQGPSTPAHLFLLGGTSAPTAAKDAQGIYLAETPTLPMGKSAGGNTGCLSPVSEWNWLINPNGRETKLVNNPLGSLCFSHDTIATLLDNAALTWKYYVAFGVTSNPGGSILNAANSIQQICQPDSNYITCTGPEWSTNIDFNPADVLTDIKNCKLSNMSWVTPVFKNSDHPGSSRGGPTGGPSWVASIVNAIGNAASCDGGAGYWSDTAILIMWDDWGGWYDHEPPTILPAPFGDYQYGFRVPFIVVSAYTPPAYVSNDRLDFGSMLRFVEGVFNIPEGALSFADARASSDLSSFFNFNQSPRSFQQIPARLSADFFINDKSPPEPADDD
jgi:phospholipase C